MMATRARPPPPPWLDRRRGLTPPTPPALARTSAEERWDSGERAGRAARRTPARPDPTHPGRRRLGRLSPGLIARTSDQSLAVTPWKRHPVRRSSPAFDGERGPRWGVTLRGHVLAPRGGVRGVVVARGGHPARRPLALRSLPCLPVWLSLVSGHSLARRSTRVRTLPPAAPQGQACLRPLKEFPAT